MTIIIDTREQHPYTFTNYDMTLRRLPVGDYSVDGFEDSICVERKSLDDYVNTVMHDWKRFEDELILMRKFRHKAIVVETSLDLVLRGEDEAVSMATPGSYLSKAFMIRNEYGVEVQFAGSRPAAVWFTEQFLWHSWVKSLKNKGNE